MKHLAVVVEQCGEGGGSGDGGEEGSDCCIGEWGGDDGVSDVKVDVIDDDDDELVVDEEVVKKEEEDDVTGGGWESEEGVVNVKKVSVGGEEDDRSMV